MATGTLPGNGEMREDRFGARLLEVGFADIKTLARECANHTGWARTTIPQLAPVLISEPFWSFWRN